MKKTNRLITVLIFIFLYIPMAVLIVASFNTGKNITQFEGFTLQQYIRLFQEQGLEAAILDTPVDKPFVSFLEYKNQDIKLKVQRVDADIDSLQEKSAEEESEAKKQAAENNANKANTATTETVENAE